MKRSVRSEALLVIIPVILIAMLALSLSSYFAAQKIIQRNIENEMQLNLSSAVEKVQISLDKNQKVAELLARSFESTSNVMNENSFENVLTSFVKTNDETFGAGIWYEPYAMYPNTQYFSRYSMRQDGKAVYVPDYSLGAGVYYNSQDWYTDVENTKESAVWSAPYYDDVAKISMVTASVPLYDKSGKFEGVATTDMNLTDLQKMVESIKPSAGSSTFLIDPSGTYIASEDASKALKLNIKDEKNASLAQIGKTMLSQKSGTGKYQQDGAAYDIWYTQVPGCNWVIATAAPESVLYSDLHSLSIQLMILGGVMTLLLIALIILFINRRIIKPLRKLEKASQEISEGNLTVQIASTSGNEIGSVSGSMQKTANRLNSYIGYIDELSQVLNLIAEGNLNFALKLDYSGEFSKLMFSIENIKQSLTQTFRQIHVSAGQVSAGASSISTGAQVLAQGTAEQASTVEELAATIQHISDNVRLNAENSSQASGRAKTVENEMSISNRKMEEMVQAMSQISDSSSQIGKIIKNIEDIAFQTNILALNAAVEAARAGSAGKGFAVVADEVRNLAGKSSEAAHRTTSLIENAIASVSSGTKILDETAQSLSLVVAGVNDISESIDHISRATNTQSEAIAQIAQGLEQISAVTQNNSATSEESASACGDLSDQARNLFSQISKFQIADTLASAE